MEILSLVANADLRARLRRAAARLAVPVRTVRPDAPLPHAPEGVVQVLVHDLEPEPAACIAWLDAAVRDHARLVVFLVLPPSSAHVAAAVLLGGRIPIVGVELWSATLDVEALADRLCRCAVESAGACVVWRAVEQWELPAPLRYLCRTALRKAATDASLRDVLRQSGVPYETARRAACRAGLPSPRRILEALRLLRAVEALCRGGRVAATAGRFAFNDADHFRVSLRRQFGMTPTEAQRCGVQALLAVLEARWRERLRAPLACGTVASDTPLLPATSAADTPDWQSPAEEGPVPWLGHATELPALRAQRA